jgi:hypothetical protein
MVWPSSHWHKLGNWYAALRDDVLFVMLAHPIHKRQALGFEPAGWNFLHGHMNMTMSGAQIKTGRAEP